MAKRKLTWRVPRWAFVPALWRELAVTLNCGSLFRITVVSGLVCVVIVLGVKLAMPPIVLPRLWQMALALLLIPLALVLQLALLSLIPPTVTICPDKIVIQHGQSATVIDSATVLATYLTVHPEDRIRLRICYTKTPTRKSRVVGVAPTVDLTLLTELLPVAPIVRDARDRTFRRDGSAKKTADLARD